MTLHAIQRAAERIGLDLSSEDLDAISAAVREVPGRATSHGRRIIEARINGRDCSLIVAPCGAIVSVQPAIVGAYAKLGDMARIVPRKAAPGRLPGITEGHSE